MPRWKWHCSMLEALDEHGLGSGIEPRGARVYVSCRSNDASRSTADLRRAAATLTAAVTSRRPRPCDRRVPQVRPGGARSCSIPRATVRARRSWRRSQPRAGQRAPSPSRWSPRTSPTYPDMFTLTTVPDQLDAAGPRHWGSLLERRRRLPRRVVRHRSLIRRAHERRDRRAVVARRTRGVGAPTPGIGASVTFSEVLAHERRPMSPDRIESLTELRAVGPWVAHMIHTWLDDPPNDRARAATARVPHVCGGAPRARSPPRLGSPHSRRPAGPQHRQRRRALSEMGEAARALRSTFIEHRPLEEPADRPRDGRDPARRPQRARRRLQRRRGRRRRSIPHPAVDRDGRSWTDRATWIRRPSKRSTSCSEPSTRSCETTDMTERYLAALRNPTVHVLAHPVARMYGRRVGCVRTGPASSRKPPDSERRSRSTRHRLDRTCAWSSRARRSPRGSGGSRSAATPTPRPNSSSCRSDSRSQSWPAFLATVY